MYPHNALRIIEATLRKGQNDGYISSSNPAFQALDTLWDLVALGPDYTSGKSK